MFITKPAKTQTDRQTDRPTDGRTDGQTDRQTDLKTLTIDVINIESTHTQTLYPTP